MENSWPALGCGLGLRTVHYDHITTHCPKNVDWFEAISENYMDTGGRPLSILEKVRARYPIALHGVSLSIGSADPLNKDYLKKLKALIRRIDPAIVSDHLCWTGVDGKNLHDLLPLPYTEETARYVIKRVKSVQEFLERPILLENVSTYFSYRHSRLAEWDFLKAVAEGARCGILLDVNNVYVNAVNHGFDPYEFLQAIPREIVGQFHLAGHTDMGGYLFDTHSKRIIDKVWELYRFAIERFGQMSTLVEWDDDIPDFEKLSQELDKAREIYRLTDFSGSPQSFGEPVHKSRRSAWTSPTRFVAGRTRKICGPKLSQLQKSMKACILPSIRPKKNLTTFGKNLNPQGKTPGVKRIDVYADGYIARMHEALGETYPAVRRILGDNDFLTVARAYAEVHPSQDYSLSRAGKHLARFLAGSSHAKKLPFLPDLAALEWRIVESFHATQEEPADTRSLKELSPEEWEAVRFCFQPSVFLVSSRWPILDIWQARNEPPGSINVDLVDRPQNVLVHRPEFQVRCELLDPGQTRLLNLLKSGKSLGQAVEAFIRSGTADNPPFTQWFSLWASLKLIKSCGQEQLA